MRVTDDPTNGPASRTVLVVEDDAAIGHMLITLLGVEGYRPILVSDGALAIDAVLTERPAVITLDLSLPNMDGLTILDRLDHAVRGAVPVVVVSAYTQRLTERHRERVAAVRVASYLRVTEWRSLPQNGMLPGDVGDRGGLA